MPIQFLSELRRLLTQRRLTVISPSVLKLTWFIIGSIQRVNVTSIVFRLLIVRVKGIFNEKNVRLFNIDNFHIRLIDLFGAGCNKDVYFAIA